MTIERDIVTLRSNIQDAERELAKAAALTLNKAATRIRQIAVPQVSDDVRVPPKNIRDRIKTIRANGTDRMPKASLRIGRRSLTAFSLGARVVSRGKNKGIVAGKGQFQRTFERAFIGSKRGDTRQQIFQRAGSSRYPLTVPRIDMAGSISRFFPAAARKVMGDDYDKMMRDEVRARLQKYGIK